METSKLRKRMPVATLLDPKIVVPAIGQAFVKLDPRHAGQKSGDVRARDRHGADHHLARARPGAASADIGFNFQIVLWLWFTVLFANFAEAVAEGRGKAQADTLRRSRTETRAKKLSDPKTASSFKAVPALDLRAGDLVVVEAGDMIPGDGDVIEGIASVNEAAITGESAPVIRESGGDRSAVTGGTTVISDWIIVRITSSPGSSFLDRMIKLVEGAERQKTPNEIALNILLVGLTIIFVFATATIPSYAAYAGGVDVGRRAGRAVRHVDPDHDRRAALGDRHCRHGPAGALQCAGHVRPRGGSRRRRRYAAARQDRHRHLRQPAGDRNYCGAGRNRARGCGSRIARQRCRRDRGRPLDHHLAQEKYNVRRQVAPAGAKFIEFSATTRMSGVDIGARKVRKGAVDSVLKFARDQAGQNIAEPPAFRAAVDKIARSGGTPLGLVDGDRILGVIHLKDVVKPDVRERFAALRRMGIKTVMITGDNPVTAAAIASEAGVDDFIAQATPEDKLRYIRGEQAHGRLIAMCGDGTNDAPALAQADVGVCMQTGTQAAREAGNMVDLDSDPTKLIEVVEIGKQLLMTRGALTTFSIANDVAKYFAIIPAMFLAFYPQLGVLNVMQLATPQSAILSAIIFNALIIIALIPLALKGVAYRPIGAAALLRRNLLVYGLGGVMLPFVGIKAIDLAVNALHLV